MPRVKNCIGTKDDKCHTCNGWKNHYMRKFSWPTRCANSKCMRAPIYGSHVTYIGQGKKEWIIPLCATCNNTTNTSIMSLHPMYSTRRVDATPCKPKPTRKISDTSNTSLCQQLSGLGRDILGRLFVYNTPGSGKKDSIFSYLFVYNTPGSGKCN